MNDLFTYLYAEYPSVLKVMLGFAIAFIVMKKIENPTYSWFQTLSESGLPILLALLGSLGIKVITFYFGPHVANYAFLALLIFLLWLRRQKVISAIKEKKIFFVLGTLLIICLVVINYWALNF